MNAIFSPGKLMLTSEYFAIDGALVLAVPTRLGQEFFFEEREDKKSLILWEAYHQDKLWLTAVIDYNNWQIVETNIPSSAEFILKTLYNVQQLSTTRFKSDLSYHLKTNLQFPADYGLGSSSTLMNNLGEWADINPFHLNSISLGGSGYDIAVAKEKSAILFQNKPEIRYEKVDFNPPFKNELIFIHLNQKQDSREGITLYKSKNKSPELINEFSDITKKILLCNELESFSELMMIHERKIADFLEILTVREKLFSDCPSFVKSLGAWGGDFVMSAKFGGFKDYFWEKGFTTVFEWPEIIGL
ncbi:30S ribosomal protein S6 [Chryseobacterium indologenes]|uniref:30S ribosomal protein S6 n=1 Tax=Chryseobacterium indologenes TaxID=253 RepID=A0AAD0YUK7_CHRID|nr:GYDIA family GHMP kinase [Chryseobacterium indologenes]ATN07587.1 30S ribosomal protein S6 [Chryseobacterium indologenes]AYY83673.1 30S ribosomal protein S6 [Chryseobacterium indologenes]AZB19309.1 30S ribosomal protein S6 [Chryseobacterium indologenes]QIX80595.1 30S ribosomal protein S6 [Chryseobacterium indologenes]TLX27234.1 30S ribosomal protein S6 [Chryseobacterium indologenes]